MDNKVIEEEKQVSEYEDEYYEEEESEEEEDESVTRSERDRKRAGAHERAKIDELQKIRQIVESQQKIPKIIIIKDEYGIEQEYEVLEESEEEGSIDLSVNRKEGDMSLRIKHNGPHSRRTDESYTDDEGQHHKRMQRVVIEGNAEESVEYYEEVIEESEEESDAMDNDHLRDLQINNVAQ